MAEQKYSAGMVSRPFWFLEFKKTVKLLNDGLSFDDIKEKNLVENIYGANKEYRAKEIYNGVTRRARMLDEELIRLFCDTGLETQKAMALFTAMKIDKLFFEFMYEVYREKILIGVKILDHSAIMIFFKDRQVHDKSAAAWADCTLKKLQNSYINYLIESGLITDKNNKHEITQPIIDPRFERYLIDNNLRPYLYAMTGVK